MAGVGAVRLISGRKSNLTFEVVSDAGRVILRDAWVQSALRSSEVPVPGIVLVDEPGEILGVPCYVMERVEGYVIRDRPPTGYAPSKSERSALVGTLVRLHAVDPILGRLGEFGRPGFLERQLRRWAIQWQGSTDKEVPEASRLRRMLPIACP
jgi:aminoglycoside phosphotransferase (APT) family kinase protein